MLKFSFKFFMLIILLLFGMLIGMNLAEKGLYSIAGNPDMSPESFQVQQVDNTIEVKVLGESYVSDLPDRVTTVETNIDATIDNQIKEKTANQDINFMGNLGNKLGEILHIGAEKSLTIIAKIVE